MNRILLFFIGAMLVFAACTVNNGDPERDPVILITFERGRIELATNAYVSEVDNIVFSRDGKSVEAGEMVPEMWYEFSKADPNEAGSFMVMTSRSQPAKNSTHLQVAKRTEGQNVCPKWGQHWFGSYCESYVASIH